MEPFRSESFFGTLKPSYNDGNDAVSFLQPFLQDFCGQPIGFLQVAKEAFRSLFQVTGECSRYENASGPLKLVMDDIKKSSWLSYGVQYSSQQQVKLPAKTFSLTRYLCFHNFGCTFTIIDVFLFVSADGNCYGIVLFCQILWHRKSTFFYLMRNYFALFIADAFNGAGEQCRCL